MKASQVELQCKEFCLCHGLYSLYQLTQEKETSVRVRVALVFPALIV